MNLQIYTRKKSFACRAAERFFKERQIKFQTISLEEKGMSLREIESVLLSVKDVDLLIDETSPLYETLYIAHLTRSPEEKKRLLAEYPGLLKAPIVRDCSSRRATVGECPAIWKSWL